MLRYDRMQITKFSFSSLNFEIDRMPHYLVSYMYNVDSLLRFHNTGCLISDSSGSL